MPYFYQDEKQKKNKILKTRLKISAECKRDWKRTLPNTKSVALLFSAFFYALNKAAWTFTLELSILKSWFFPFSLHLIAHNVGYYLISLFFLGVSTISSAPRSFTVAAENVPSETVWEAQFTQKKLYWMIWKEFSAGFCSARTYKKMCVFWQQERKRHGNWFIFVASIEESYWERF